jgi:hypothetical protein
MMLMVNRPRSTQSEPTRLLKSRMIGTPSFAWLKVPSTADEEFVTFKATVSTKRRTLPFPATDLRCVQQLNLLIGDTPANEKVDCSMCLTPIVLIPFCLPLSI